MFLFFIVAHCPPTCPCSVLSDPLALILIRLSLPIPTVSSPPCGSQHAPQTPRKTCREDHTSHRFFLIGSVLEFGLVSSPSKAPLHPLRNTTSAKSPSRFSFFPIISCSFFCTLSQMLARESKVLHLIPSANDTRNRQCHQTNVAVSAALWHCRLAHLLHCSNTLQLEPNGMLFHCFLRQLFRARSLLLSLLCSVVQFDIAKSRSLSELCTAPFSPPTP